jgi:hypothetical protein
MAAAISSGASSAQTGHELRMSGLTVMAPASWHLAHEQLTDCIRPNQVLAFTDVIGALGKPATLPRGRALIVLAEAGGAGKGFPAHTRFRVPAHLDVMGGCCEMPFGRGFGLSFRDHGRNFYAFVYAADRRIATRAVAVLNTLRVS